MGRRSLSQVESVQLKERMAAELSLHIALNGTNKAQFRAQLYEEDAVQLVWDIAQDPESTSVLRLEAARQIVTWARGAPKSYQDNGGRTIDPSGPMLGGGTIGESLDTIRAASELFLKLDDLVRRNVPYENWPAEVQALPEAMDFAPENIILDAKAIAMGEGLPERG